MVSFGPMNSIQWLGLEGGSCLDRLLGGFVFVAGWRDAMTILRSLTSAARTSSQRSMTFPKRLYLRPSASSSFSEHRCPPHALEFDLP